MSAFHLIATIDRDNPALVTQGFINLARAERSLSPDQCDETTIPCSARAWYRR